MIIMPMSPLALILELTTNCSLKCCFCPRKDYGTKFGNMDMGLFRKLVDEAVEWGVGRLIFDKDGDPLLSPNLIEALKYVRSKSPDIIVSFNTPAAHFPKKYMVGLLENNLTKICFSVLAAYPETYKNITGYDYLEQVEDNIVDFIDLKNQMSAKTKVIVKMNYLDTITPTEMIEFKSKWCIRGINSINIDPVFDWYNLYEKKPCVFTTESKTFCTDPLTSINTNWDGTVSVCCLDARKEYIVGDLNKQTIMEVWDGPELQNYRNKIINRETDKIEPCMYCNRWRIRDGKN